ncbi:VOC family protein [Streptomyces sp. NPDC013187]|uniref:VOC family protein n=1 Tax=Streptomyces sp. NPDC013187 TaxID=3364865 RepID=UPI0036C04855
MIAKLRCVVLDCADVIGLSRFYRWLLGGEVDQPDPRWSLDDGWATLHTEGGSVLAFQRVGDYQPPRGRDLVLRQRFHLDLEVRDPDQAQADVLDLGATLLDDAEAKRGWRIFAGPAGHPFCLVRH